MIKQSLLNLNHTEPKNKFNLNQDFSKPRDHFNPHIRKSISVLPFKRGIIASFKSKFSKLHK